ncbi:MAG: hypothetical protein QF408_03075 [Pirellulales bacterium]|jgi:hypothetical protein|nr:hypothetical protein [Pirellulales bacterium]
MMIAAAGVMAARRSWTAATMMAIAARKESRVEMKRADVSLQETQFKI